jgi:co-chaperonin GroES (HSP10)
MAKAVGHLILVRPDPVEEVTKGGIVLATDKKMERNATTKGVVVQVGPEAFMAFQKASGIPLDQMKPWVNAGDHIYYAKYAGSWIDEGEEKEPLLFIRDEDVVGIV